MYNKQIFNQKYTYSERRKIVEPAYSPLLYPNYFLLYRVWQEKEENKALQVLQGFRCVHSFFLKKKINSHIFQLKLEKFNQVMYNKTQLQN